MSILNKLVCASALALTVGVAVADNDRHDDRSANITVFAPGAGDVAGVSSRGFLVDLAVEFEGDLASTGASSELTGPGPLQNAGPFPGTFSLGANKDHFPGLVVLLSSTAASATNAGPGQNVSNLFNIISVTNRTPTATEIWGTWIIGAKNVFGVEGQMTPSRLFVTVVEGLAPDVVLDLNGDGKFNAKDLKLMGYNVIAKSRHVDFIVNGLP
ncbi:MAG: hypothetical protein Q8L39_10255 [Burkholderiales bacterium]|nr:hypothetical protein [Burkholderiales bacterium]